MQNFTPAPAINLDQHILWQYDQAARLKSLITSKQAWLTQNFTQFWADWYDNIFDVLQDTTISDNPQFTTNKQRFGLTVWGAILNLDRTLICKDGTSKQLTDLQYQLLLRGQLLKYKQACTISQCQAYVDLILGDKGICLVTDGGLTGKPMTMTYDFQFEISQEQNAQWLWLLQNIDFLPRPAGVGVNIYANGQVLASIDKFYQLQITVPADITPVIYINGIERPDGYAMLTKGTDYSWSIEADGMQTLTGTGTMGDENININIAQFRIIAIPSDALVTVNNTNNYGLFFIEGTEQNITWSVSREGYVAQNGSQTINSELIYFIDLEKLTTELVENETSGTYLIPYAGYWKITARGACVRRKIPKNENFPPIKAPSGISEATLFLPKNTEINYRYWTNNYKVLGLIERNYGGALEIKLNQEVLMISGGGGTIEQMTGFENMDVVGGCGYEGGAIALVNNAAGQQGISQDSSLGNSTITEEFACGGKAIASNTSGTATAYGGTSYANPDYYNVIMQTHGGNFVRRYIENSAYVSEFSPNTGNIQEDGAELKDYATLVIEWLGAEQ